MFPEQQRSAPCSPMVPGSKVQCSTALKDVVDIHLREGTEQGAGMKVNRVMPPSEVMLPCKGWPRELPDV